MTRISGHFPLGCLQAVVLFAQPIGSRAGNIGDLVNRLASPCERLRTLEDNCADSERG